MTWVDWAAAAYLVVGLALAAFVYAVMVGDLQPPDDVLDRDTAFMFDLMRLALDLPETRVRLAAITTALCVLLVFGWAVLLPILVVTAPRK